ncbi:MAG: hypothetical protein M0R21_06730 [Lentimicrobiaceae bacterium]|nr:hypothetical protein [Lentimicrobiaceae bacterium]
MRKLITLLILFFLWAGSSWGQSTANYAFTYAFNGSLQDISTGATVMLTGNKDDAASAVFDIGFTFYFMGTPYTQFSANSNGQIRLGSVLTATTYSNYVASTAVLSPMSGDNEVNNGMSFKVIGTAPNRILVVEWNQFYVYYTNITNAGNMQALLYEGTGKIEYIYGEIYNTSTGSVTRSTFISSSNVTTTGGSVTVAATPTYESVATSPTSNSFAASVLIANLASTAQGSRTVYTFTPTYSTTPADPINMTFTSVTSSTITVNWVDNSTDETFFTAKRALDAGFTTGVVTASVASTTIAGTGTAYNSAFTGLVPGTTYYFKITANNEGSASPGLTGNQATSPPGNITSAADGAWSATSTWVGGVVPTTADNVIIDHNVNVDAATNICFNLTINNGKTLASTGTAGILTIAGNLTNNGTLDFYTDASNSARLTFTSASNNTFTSGASCTTDLNTLTINKGTANTNILDMDLTSLTIKGISTATVGFLTLTNGTLKISGSNTFDGAVFTSTSYSISATCGFWLNNTNFIVNGQNGSPTLAGLLRISNGTLNVGTVSNNSMGFSSGATVVIEGGTVIATGRFGVTSTSYIINYTQTGGNVTVCTLGNTSTSYASFDLGTAATSTATLGGGTITIQLASTATSGPRDFRGLSTGTAPTTYAGTTLYLGNASSGATAQTYYLAGRVPPFVITTTSATHKVAIYSSIYYHGDLTIPAGSDLNLNGYGFWCKGNVVNNGTITGTTTSSRFDFAGSLLETSPAAQTYSGTGTFGPSATLTTNLSLGINNSNGVTFNAPANVYRVNLFKGIITNSNNITIGNGLALTCYVQIGVSGNADPGGSFDVSPIFNLGTGAYTVLYEPESTPRTIGFEIPPSRTITTLSINNANGVTLAGGNLTLDAAGVLSMTEGTLTTSATNMLTLNNTGAAVSGGSTTSFVVGPIARTFAASRTATGTYTGATLFPIGKDGIYSPMWVDPTTNAGGTVVFTGEVFNRNIGTKGTGVISLAKGIRWEAIATSGNANLTSTFLSLGSSSITNVNQILQANAAAGVYGAIPSVSTFASGIPNTLSTTGSQIPAGSYYGYFGFGELQSCAAPTTQPTAFVASYITSTGFTGSFTAASPAPSNYLVVRYTAPSTPTNPVDYTTYTVGGTLGTGTVVSVSDATTFTQMGLIPGTSYDYYVYSYNNSGCYGPVYLTTSPSLLNVTTCATDIGLPGTPTSSLISTTGFTASWTASSTTDVSYILDVATDAAFTSFVTGYNGLDVGIGTLTYPVTGLTAATTYYVRVRANSGGTCYSNYTSTLVVTTSCNPITSLPWTESFEGVTIPAIPSCWFKENGDWVTTNNSNSTYDADAHTGTQFLRDAYSATNEYVWTPGFDLTAGTSYDFSFWWAGDGDANWVGDVFYNTTPISTGATQLGASFVTSATVTTKTYAQVISTFVPLTSGAYYFAIRVNATSAPWYISFDDFKLDLSPSCTTPMTLTATSITPNSASLGWTETGTATLWNIELGTFGFTPTGTPTQSGVTNPYTYSGLTPNTSYSYYVQADCGSGSTSTWTGPYSFTTPCEAVTSLPWNEGFEGVTIPAIPSCWFKENGDWVTTNNVNTANDADAHTGTQFLRDSWSATNEYVWTPGFDLTAGTSYDFSFWWAGDNYSNWVGDVFYNTSPISTGATQLGASFVVSTTVTTKDYAQVVSTFVPSTSGTYYFAIRVNEATGDPWYISLDDFKLELTPSCPAPTILTATSITANSASLGWTETGTATLWNIELGTFGFTPTGTPTQSGVTNPYTYSGLSTNTQYSYYVQADCGSGSTSTWTGPYSFTTLCDASTLPYLETFDGMWTSPVPNSCWISDVIATSNIAWHRNDYTSNWTYPTGGSPIETGANGTPNYARFHSYGLNSDLNSYMQTGVINLSSYSASDAVNLKFYYINLTGTDQLDVYFSADGGSTWSASMEPGPFVTSETWTEMTIPVDLSVYNTANFMVRFLATSDYGDDDIGIDEISVAVAPSTKTLNLKFYLEGLYAGAGVMNQAQDDMGAHYLAPIADKVTVKLHDANYAIMVGIYADQDLNTDGTCSVTIPGTDNGNYYISIHTRNHLETVSASTVSFAGSTIAYDFSTADNQAYGSGSNMKDFSGVYAFWAGDVNLDSFIDSGDMAPVDNDAAAFVMGWSDNDVNGDGFVDSADMTIIDNNAAAFIMAQTP